MRDLLTRARGEAAYKPPWTWVFALTRWASGVIFVAFGAAKFLNHGAETSSFDAYGLPWPGVFAYAVGALELAGGGLLIAGVALRPTALLLAGDMVGAIVLSGLLRGERISLTLAPLLLLAMGVVWISESRLSPKGIMPAGPRGVGVG